MYGNTNMGAAPMAAPATYGAPMSYATAAPVNYSTTAMAAAPTATYATAAPNYANYAAPMSYAAPMAYAAPMTTQAPSYVAAPVAMPQTYAAPMAYTAPQMTYAPPMTTQVPSYVAPPVAMPQMMPQMIPTPQAPIQPQRLTNGIPTPEQIAQQKAGYSKALDKQLQEAIDTVQKETVIEKEMIRFTAEKTIALYHMQVDERLIEAMATADEQATFALLELNKAKVERSLQLSNQANGLIMDYQMKAVQSELAQRQYAFQVQQQQAEGALQEQYNQQVAQANTGTPYSVPAR